MTLDRRDFLRLSALSGAAAATGIAAAPRSAEAATAPTRPRTLLRGGYILTMDATLGDLRGDVLIDNGKIITCGDIDTLLKDHKQQSLETLFLELTGKGYRNDV